MVLNNIGLCILAAAIPFVVLTQPQQSFKGNQQDLSSMENQPLSPCCAEKIANCMRVEMDCEDYIKPPHLIKSCRCVVTIVQEYQRFKQQCLSEAIEIGIKRAENEARRVIQGPTPETVRREPARRGKIVLSETYLQEKFRQQNKNAENSQPVTTSTNAYNMVTTASTPSSDAGPNRKRRDTTNGALPDFGTKGFIDRTKSECCNAIDLYCTTRGRQCEDYIKPKTLVTTCSCQTPNYQTNKFRLFQI